MIRYRIMVRNHIHNKALDAISMSHGAAACRYYCRVSIGGE